ncbi:MAG: phosphate ABC transporter substrate-binding protein, PhoT family [Alphaproteobacteria bacterium]|nr:MAG: phosphate ABC transporter substrate-binding protein, PhoT family [Alphaproteobacteria bacterium]
MRLLALWLLLLAAPAAANDSLPSYVPRQAVSGTISIWGHGAYGKRLEFIEGLVSGWEEAFRAYHPGIRFKNRLHGTASAIGALYMGTGDLALLGREIWPPEIAAFEEVFGYPPTGIEVMTGSLDVRNKGYAIAIFVHKDNPIKGLTLAQLDAIYGVERRRGLAPVNSWGDLGLTGAWADRPINLYGLPIARGFAIYLQDRVFLGSQLWKPSLREFPDDPHSVSVETDGAGRMLATLAADPYGIGYAGLAYSDPGVKVVPLAEHAGEPFVMPTRESVADRNYPLTRIISLFINKPPDRPAQPKVAEFIRYLLSREGQDVVEREGGGYLPLPTAIAKREIEKLDTPVDK